VHRDRTASPRRGLVSLAEVPQADLKTALPPSLAEALAGDDRTASKKRINSKAKKNTLLLVVCA
jgi:hypothetical protein